MDIKPCPFCGESAKLMVDGYKSRWVMCDNCGASTSEFGVITDEQAVERWNRRATTPTQEHNNG